MDVDEIERRDSERTKKGCLIVLAIPFALLGMCSAVQIGESLLATLPAALADALPYLAIVAVFLALIGFEKFRRHRRSKLPEDPPLKPRPQEPETP